jgi:DNA-binding beta-propeller fold protein YncE
VITPDGRTMYVTNPWLVTPVSIRTNTAGSSIDVGLDPFNIAITKDGATLYAVNFQRGNNTLLGAVTPVSTATNRPGKQIPLGEDPGPIVITPPRCHR